MHHQQEQCEADDIETCLADSRLRDDQRHLLAVMLKWQRGHIAALRAEHQAADRRIEELTRGLQDHLNEAAPALQLIREHEKTFQRVDTIMRLAFCRSWQIIIAVLGALFLFIELAEHLGWMKVPH